MATLIPTLNSSLPRMTSGEKRLAQRLESLLGTDWLVWYNVPIGARQRHPDFIALHPEHGLLVLEVKDWKLDQIRVINPLTATLQFAEGLKELSNPLHQARVYAHAIKHVLERDPQLVAPIDGPHAGKLVCPFGYGAVLSNITRKEFDGAELHQVLPAQFVLCKDEMTESTTADAFRKKLTAMFTVQFACTLSAAQIDRIRHHLFPEVRIQGRDSKILRTMDLQQERLARGLGEGHRIIHGVAGSGKTLILVHRCIRLAKTTKKPVLVLCFNIALAAKLEQLIDQRRFAGRVIVRHFHGWCMDQLRLYQLTKPEEGDRFPGRLVRAVTQAVEKEEIPRGQYGAILIDEAHDFEPEWLQLAAKMVDAQTNSLLLLYDDAQSIYGKKRSRDFSFAKWGIQARGRTTVLRVNYRNTAEVLDRAYDFAKEALVPEENRTEEDAIPFIAPETAGRHGPQPVLKQCASLQEEVRYIAEQLRSLHAQGQAWKDMAVLYPARFIGEEIANHFKAQHIPIEWLQETEHSRRFHPDADSVKAMTLHSSKGLEFPVVAIAGIGFMPYRADEAMEDARLLYVGMTRASERLLLTAHKASEFVQPLLGTKGDIRLGMHSPKKALR